MLRYSDIINHAFYNIRLTQDQACLIDVHFLAASHHYWRYGDSGNTFHKLLALEHIKRMMKVIRSGNFSHANDPSKNGLDDASGWIFRGKLPHNEMFDSMDPDVRFIDGESHPYDIVLSGVKIPPRQIEAMVQFDCISV